MPILVLVAPFIRPANKVGDTPPLPYYLYCLIGIAVIAFGVLYWAVWRLVLPYVFKFRLVPRKEVLEDGTVVTLVSQLAEFYTWVPSVEWPADVNLVLQRRGEKGDIKVMREASDEEYSRDIIVRCNHIHHSNFLNKTSRT